jgi:bifunctional non-homologous end joining protein LigD
MLLRTTFIPPCLPSPAERPPVGSGWLHEIKHDGYRLMARGAVWLRARLKRRVERSND